MKALDQVIENIEATGYSYRSHRLEEMARAVLSGSRLLRLDTGSYGEDDLLLADSKEEAVADVLSAMEREDLFDGWSLADITDIAVAGVRLTGWTAINFAESHGLTLEKYADPIEGHRSGIDPEEAQEIAREDSGLIYLQL